MSFKYEPVIGLEVHVQLKTRTKVFCGCANRFGDPENSNICPVCLGLPGSLPVLNAVALKESLKVGLALGATPRSFIKFDRKNYYYPDLPKNFQISQFDLPVAEQGGLEIDVGGRTRRVRIKRVHLEEDAGKLLHDETRRVSRVDYNRAGTPLLEIVSEPDLFGPDEAYAYLSELKLLLQYLGVSDCDMEKGSLRCDANISLRLAGTKTLGTKAELKNMNSFKAVRAALEHEIERQAVLLSAGERVVQETRLWDEASGATVSMRSKEEAHDYRYFPEPDLPPFTFSRDEIEAVRRSIPELPRQRFARFCETYRFSEKDAGVLVASKEFADFFEACVNAGGDPRKVAHWLTGPVFGQMNVRQASLGDLGLSPSLLVGLIDKVETGVISQLTGKDVLNEMIERHADADTIIREKDLAQVSGAEALSGVIEEVISANARVVEDFRAGKENAVMYLVGQVMRLSGGKANPKVARELLIRRLSSL